VKPNKEEKSRIDRIITSVGNAMKPDEMDFLYRFRYSLTENKKALIKFLYALNWDEDNEVAELPTLLALWKERAPIDVADALKLLSK
jgi:phosphatidylinositol 3-kinase